MPAGADASRRPAERLASPLAARLQTRPGEPSAARGEPARQVPPGPAISVVPAVADADPGDLVDEVLKRTESLRSPKEGQ
jgi:hypothetical protein